MRTVFEESGQITNEPMFDLVKCCACGWYGKIGECDIETEGDWENGYYDVDLCPNCEDGGEIEYDMSEKQTILWNEWYKKREQND